MDRSDEVLQHLQQLSIPYILYRHEPMLTIEACQHIEGVDWQQAAMCKNVFLCNRQQTAFYLMLLQHDRPFRTAVVSKLLGVSRLSFAPEDRLPQMLGLLPGAVSPLGLIFDTANQVRLVVDDVITQPQRLLFHPCVNHLTVELQTDDFFQRFLPATGHAPTMITLPQE
ncbi:MAG: prolyl-tRNA synthetase associated domain-containing protein [Clostridiales bacterium]|nr:prolyl-tRNA synthetase associated domain-containing protein [Clostridiales bacterium]